MAKLSDKFAILWCGMSLNVPTLALLVITWLTSNKFTLHELRVACDQLNLSDLLLNSYAIKHASGNFFKFEV